MEPEPNLPNQKTDLEQQFILRLPAPEAEKVRYILQNKPDKIKKTLKLDLNPCENSAVVLVGKQKLYGTLQNLPTIVESYKTYDKLNLFKTADIHQLLLCDYVESTDKSFEHLHGIAPPLKNAKKRRFRKTLINTDQAIEVENIEKELYYLLRTDFEAVCSKYEVTNPNEDDEDNKENTDDNNEITLFGNISSEMSNDESE